MKIVVASDSHYYNDVLNEIVEKNPDAKLFLHCGDLEGDPMEYPQWIFVRGNNDYMPGMQDMRFLELDGHRILMLHSHRCSYCSREEQLMHLAMEHECDIVLYGHTHVANVVRKNGILIMNPGSTFHCRDGKSPSYATLEIDGNRVVPTIIRRENW